MTDLKKVGKAKFPTKELKAWLKGRKAWEHNEWIALIVDLRTKGYNAVTDVQEGRDSIGKFLDANRNK
jgi:hypothetical protein